MVLPFAATAVSNLLPNLLSSRTPTPLISGLFASIQRARSTPPAALPPKFFALVLAANPLPFLIPRISWLRPSPSIPKASSTLALPRTARSIASPRPAKNRSSSIPKQNTSGTSHSVPTVFFTSPPAIKARFSPSLPTVRASSFTPATKPTSVSSLSTRTTIFSPAPNPTAASFASRVPAPNPHAKKKSPGQPHLPPKALSFTKPPSAKSPLSLSLPTAPFTSPPSAKNSAPPLRLPLRSSLRRKEPPPSPPAV